MSEETQSLFDRLIQPVLAFRFFTIAIVIHLLIVTFFGGRVLFNKYVEPPDFQAVGDTSVSTDAPAPPPDTPADTLPPAPAVNTPPAPAPAANLAALTSANPDSSTFAMPLPPVAPPTISNDIAPTPATPAQQFGAGPAVGLPGVMGGRSGSGRASAGQRYGEKPAAEQSVLRALRWLQAQQHTDGTWGDAPNHDAYTGLALLCFLGHGETPQTSREFGVVVTNAINALLAEGARNAAHFSGRRDFHLQPAVYQHAICAYALGEAYTMTKDERIAPILTQAVDYILQGQRPDGGWGYTYDIGPDDPKKPPKSDTSVSGWQIQALKAAHLTGIPGLDAKVRPVLDLAMKNLDRVFNPTDGSFGYRKAGDSDYSLTGVGVLSKLFWLGRADRSVHEGLKNIESRDLAYSGPDCNLYAWYYDTQACYQAQGGAWDWWKDRFQDQLLGAQAPDGSWPPTQTTSKVQGIRATETLSNDPAGDGPIYRTTLCCLMLEVFYRYLPSSQENGMNGNVEGL